MTSNGAPICGDPLCVSNTGACESDGFHPCVDGKIAAAAQACSSGSCVATGTASSATNGFTPGQCQAECATGDTKCAGVSGTTVNYQTCVNGRWSGTTTACASNKCIQYADATTSAPRTVCGLCAPGSHRCTDNMGNAMATGSDIETCDSTGAWGAHAGCAAGSCAPSGLDAACFAQCVPGATVCVGTAPVGAPNPLHPGTIAQVVCTAQGTLPAVPLAADCTGGTPPPSCCVAGTSCRKGPSGQPVGTGSAACVACVGSALAGGNELGLVDSMCPTATTIEACQADNTWAAATACSPGPTCVTETAGGTCGTFCPGGTCSQSNLASHGTSCQNLFGNPSVTPCGAVGDCCVVACGGGAGGPTPAICQ
jgi:hypothetical protein